MIIMNSMALIWDEYWMLVSALINYMNPEYFALAATDLKP